jgi:hypothetical protein
MDWVAEQERLEAQREQTLEAMRRLRPGVWSRPKDFMAFHDADRAFNEAKQRLTAFCEERFRIERAGEPKDAAAVEDSLAHQIEALEDKVSNIPQGGRPSAEAGMNTMR